MSEVVLYSQKAEVKFIKTVTCKDITEEIRLKMLSRVSSVEFFHYPPTRAAYLRIMVFVRKKSEIITFEDILEDPAVEKDFREVLEAINISECSSKKEISKMMDVLEKYRKIRALHKTASDILNALGSEKFEIDEVLDVAATNITKARQITSETELMFLSGKNGNARELVKKVLYDKIPPMLKTGFSAYDELNGGLPKDGVLLIAASTSGGKSTMLLNLLRNIHLINKVSVGKISLEMSMRQETNRLLSNLSGIHYKKFVQGLLTKAEKIKATEAFARFDSFGERHECRYASLSPERDMSIEDVFLTTKPYGFKVVGIDYISLLKGVNQSNQWQILGDITAQAKIYSRTNNTLVVILAQLDGETEKVRYSQGIQENVDVLWKWNYQKKEVREQRILDINIGKARDGELGSFPLSEAFEVMAIYDVEESSDDLRASDDDDEADTLLNAKAGVD